MNTIPVTEQRRVTVMRAAACAALVAGCVVGAMAPTRDVKAGAPVPPAAIHMMYADQFWITKANLEQQDGLKLVAYAKAGPPGSKKGFWGFKLDETTYVKLDLLEWYDANAKAGDLPDCIEWATPAWVQATGGDPVVYAWLSMSWNPNKYNAGLFNAATSFGPIFLPPQVYPPYYRSDLGSYQVGWWAFNNAGTETYKELEWFETQ